MQFKTTTAAMAAILAFCASTTSATTFHNKDTAYYVNVEKTDGSTTYVEPNGSTEVGDGWAYIRACQLYGGGNAFYCPPGLLTWPSWYGEVFFYLGGLTDASGTEIASSGDCTFGAMFFDPNECPAGYQNL
ncbi:hypothetical protein FQN54_006484 [Arachnomyces sp. PD_36]|nr:hypothetical protein FQN54_006484 [Arachnomyces sp. PD_36]